MKTETEAEAIRDLSVAHVEPKSVHKDHDFAIVPNGYTLFGLDQFQEAPRRITASPSFQSLDSFLAYVKKHKDGDTAIFLSVDSAATAVLDYHGHNDPRWGSHRASFTPKKSERWDAWLLACKRSFTQREFAEFIEDNIADFLAPPGAEMLTTAKTLQIKKDVLFKSDVRLDNGDVKLQYEETTKAGGRGDVDIPTEFTILIPVLESETPRDIEVRLKCKLEDGRVTFNLAIKNQQALLDQVKRYIYATIKNDSGILPYLGQP